MTIDQKPLTWIEIVVLFVVILLYGLATYQRNLVWKYDLSLWSDVVKKSPYKARPHNNIGLALNNNNLVDKAILELKKALRLKPDYVEAYGNLGNSYMKRGMIDQAISTYIEALIFKPDYVKARINLAAAYGTKGWLDRAIEELKMILDIYPDEPDAHYNIGIAYNLIGLKELAITELNKSLHLRPDDIRALYYLGEIYLYDMKDPWSALSCYRRILSINPYDRYAHMAKNRIQEIGP
jgi:tetratricopeptide (TPR) repeat protein